MSFKSLRPFQVRELLNEKFKETPKGKILQNLNDWWAANSRRTIVKLHGDKICPISETAFGMFIDKKCSPNNIDPKHLLFLQVYLDDWFTPKGHKLREVPKSVAQRGYDNKQILDGSRQKRKLEKQDRATRERKIATPSTATATTTATTGKKIKVINKEINRQDQRKFRERKTHRVLCLGMKTLKRVEYAKMTNAAPTDKIRIDAMWKGLAYGIKYDVITGSCDGLFEDSGGEKLNLDSKRHWSVSWKSSRIEGNCPFVEGPPIEYMILDYYYNQAPSWFDENYYTKQFITHMIPYCFDQLKLQKCILPNYDCATHPNHTITKFCGSFQDIKHFKKDKNIRIIILDGNEDPIELHPIFKFSTYFNEKDPKGKYEFILQPILANANPLYVATDHHDTVKKLKMWSELNSKALERLNEGNMTLYNSTHPFVLITCKKKKSSSSWTLPNVIVGTTRVAKVFHENENEKKIFYGTVVEEWKKDGNDGNLFWSIKYDDGDCEDMNEQELTSAWKLYKQKGRFDTKKPIVPAAAAAAATVTMTTTSSARIVPAITAATTTTSATPPMTNNSSDGTASAGQQQQQQQIMPYSYILNKCPYT